MSSPIDLLFSNNYIDENIQKNRLDICLSCDRLFNLTKQCKECGCVMPMKVKLKDASCPIGKW